MQLYNTLTKTKENLIPRHDKKIQIFVCGPTVYDYVHIGNARTFVFFDVVAKYLRSQGYEVDYIQNITDIDDKIITQAKEAGYEPLDWAKEYYEKFKEDMTGLGVNSAKYIPATEHIEQVVRQVKTLIDKGHAYLIEGDGWYFDLSTFKDYGKLSGRTTQMADDGVSRIDENDKKRNRGDFCLWKISKPGEPSWDFETAKAVPALTKASAGRPGWHIEDTAITEHFFGPQYDIHGGGQDLIFPHHEAEITQQESASGKKPFVKYWLHVAFLVKNNEKMSKSLGNFETAHNLLRKYSKETLRFYLLSGHYRQPLNYEDDAFKQARAAIQRIGEFIQKINQADGKYNGEIDSAVQVLEDKLITAMNNDFNTPEAFGGLFEFIKTINPLLTKNEMSRDQAKKIADTLKGLDDILGIIPPSQKEIPDEVRELVEKREKLREDKNYEESDKIRAQISTSGYEIEDTIYGPLTIKKL